MARSDRSTNWCAAKTVDLMIDRFGSEDMLYRKKSRSRVRKGV